MSDKPESEAPSTGESRDLELHKYPDGSVVMSSLQVPGHFIAGLSWQRWVKGANGKIEHFPTRDAAEDALAELGEGPKSRRCKEMPGMDRLLDAVLSPEKDDAEESKVD